MSLFKITFLAITLLQVTHGANILFFLQFGSYSHRIAMWPLVEELAKTHNVTFHQLHPAKTTSPNVKEFNPFKKSIFGEDGGNKFNPLVTRLEGGIYETTKQYFVLPFIGLFICETFLDLPETQEWIQNNHFDLVVIDFLYNECGYGLAQKWGAKTIVYYTSHPSGVWGPEILGFMETGETSWITDICVTFQMPMSFFSRVITTVYTGIIHIIKEYYYYPQLTKLFKEKLQMHDMPSISELVKNTDLAFYNSHFSDELARSLPPLYVSVPALHAWGKKPKPLPKDIAEFVNGSGDKGFIYVSFGTEADPTTAPLSFQNMLFESFAESNIRFLWKWTGKRPTDLTQNIYTAKWMPQYDILASPNCKGFVGHGGLLGIQEAILNAVPMITVPFFAEQDYNADTLHRMERGLKLEPRTLTKEQLTNAIQEILSNKKYKENMSKASKQLKDQLNTPLETAVYWTEYVLRSDDMSTFKPLKAKHHYWFQLQLLDVWGFLLLATTFCCYALYCLKKFVGKCFLRRSTIASKSKTKLN